MTTHQYKVKRGLDLPIAGEPAQRIDDGAAVTRVALIAADYAGMRPTFFVKEGETVTRGQTLFEDKKSPGTMYTSPASGTLTAINRGDKRALQSVVIELNDAERSGQGEAVTFENYSGRDIAGLSRDDIRALLVESGLWTSFRARPFGRVAPVDGTPDSIFITAMDTNPLAPSVDAVLEGQEEAFDLGLSAIAKLREGRIYLCKSPESKITVGPYAGIETCEFSGPHPSGTPGYHIHRLRPVHRARVAWHLNYQDVIAIGHLFKTGALHVERVISLAGPQVSNPRLVRTRVGASVDDLTASELGEGRTRCVSGPVLSGRSAMGDVHGFLGRYHHQVTALLEGDQREFLGWMGPGQDTFSVTNLFVSAIQRGRKKFAFTTSTEGSERAMVPIGLYEKVLPMDMMPTHLLRAIIVGDIERAERLGVLELDEEDLALCTFVCPGKYEYGPYLRRMLTQIESEG